MKVGIINPAVYLVVRGKSSTTVILREPSGQQVELTWVSGHVLDQFVCDIDDATTALITGDLEWHGVEFDAVQAMQQQQTQPDSLHAAGMLDTPGDRPPGLTRASSGRKRAKPQS